MKTLHLLLLAACAFVVSACAHHHDHNHGHVGDGMAGQTVGTSFPRHMGAGGDDTHGSHTH